jgi:hypothetical protein
MTNKLSSLLKGLAALVALALFALPSSADADLVLNVDLTVTDQITITALTGNSTNTVSGSDGIGFYLQDFFAAGGITDTLVSGNLTSAANVSNMTPNLFSIDTGLNVFSYTDDPSSDFTAGAQAFAGIGTWTITNANYLDALAGLNTGTVWAIADSFDDIPPGGGSALAIGDYIVKKPGGAVPEPTSIALIGLGCVGFAFRRRRA